MVPFCLPFCVPLSVSSCAWHDIQLLLYCRQPCVKFFIFLTCLFNTLKEKLFYSRYFTGRVLVKVNMQTCWALCVSFDWNTHTHALTLHSPAVKQMSPLILKSPIRKVSWEIKQISSSHNHFYKAHTPQPLPSPPPQSLCFILSPSSSFLSSPMFFISAAMVTILLKSVCIWFLQANRNEIQSLLWFI